MDCICLKKFKNATELFNHLRKCDEAKKIGKEKSKVYCLEKNYGITKEIFYKEYIINTNGLRYLSRLFQLQIPQLKFLAKEYNIELRSVNESIKIQNEKNKEYFLNIYGVENPFQIPQVIDIIQSKRNKNKEELYKQLKKNNFEKYGVENVFQLEEVKEKSKQTLIEKYGTDNISKVYAIVEKKRAIFLKKIGVINPLLLKENRPKRRSILQIKIENLLNSWNIEFESEIKIDKYFVDIVISSKKLIIEINGDFWHANPEKYLAEDIVMFPGTNGLGVLAIDLWKKDLKKKNIIEKITQYEYIILLESDIKI